MRWMVMPSRRLWDWGTHAATLNTLSGIEEGDTESRIRLALKRLESVVKLRLCHPRPRPFDGRAEGSRV